MKLAESCDDAPGPRALEMYASWRGKFAFILPRRRTFELAHRLLDEAGIARP